MLQDIRAAFGIDKGINKEEIYHETIHIIFLITGYRGFSSDGQLPGSICRGDRDGGYY